jgi:single stranded DNA-binding protein
MKTIIFDGRVGQNGTEVKTSKNGKLYARFTVANNAYVNGEEQTEWFDVTVYDPTFIEKRAQYLGKGSYVIVTGSIRTEIRPDKTGKIWVNHYVTATNVDTPRLGGKNENRDSVSTSTPVVSTFTGGTKSDLTETMQTPALQVNIPSQITVQPQPNVAVSVAGVGATSSVNDVDDLPF